MLPTVCCMPLVEAVLAEDDADELGPRSRRSPTPPACGC